MKLVLVALVTVLCACTSYSVVEPLADGSYMLTASDVHSRSDVSENASERAEKFCARNGKGAQLIDVTYGTRFAGPQQATITFRCTTR